MIELLAPRAIPRRCAAPSTPGRTRSISARRPSTRAPRPAISGRTSLERAFSFCRTYGVKAYITLNTLVSDRELPDALALIDGLCALGGPDALIVQDLGLAAALHRRYPALPLHASTR